MGTAAAAAVLWPEAKEHFYDDDGEALAWLATVDPEPPPMTPQQEDEMSETMPMPDPVPEGERREQQLVYLEEITDRLVQSLDRFADAAQRVEAAADRMSAAAPRRESVAETYTIRPTWRHPVHRLRWRRRYGKAKAIVTVTIGVDTSHVKRQLAQMQRDLERLC